MQQIRSVTIEFDIEGKKALFVRFFIIVKILSERILILGSDIIPFPDQSRSLCEEAHAG